MLKSSFVYRLQRPASMSCFGQLLLHQVEQQGEEHGGILLAALADVGEVAAAPRPDDAAQVGGAGRLPGLGTPVDAVDLITQHGGALHGRVRLVVQEEPADDGDGMQ